MSSEDPRERDHLCGQELVPEEPWEDLDKEYDPDTWYETEDDAHYCCREVWDGGDDARCIWHADAANKPADVLLEAQSDESKRFDMAVLRECTLPDEVSLEGCRLPKADLSNANLRGADLSNANLRGADLSDADLMGADLEDAVLRDANLDRAILRLASLFSTNFRGADLEDAVLHGANLNDADLVDADLSSVDASGARLMSAELRHAVIGSADLNGTYLRGADLRSTELDGVDLTRANLSEGNLRYAELCDAHLRNSNLDSTDLRHADLVDADLKRVKLKDTDLQHADLGGADLRHTNITETDLRHANLAETDLRDAKFTASKFRQTTFDEAAFDEATDFGVSSGHEKTADEATEEESRLARRVSSRFRALGRPFTDPDPLEKAETQYRTIQRLKREHDLKQDINLEIQEKHARRKRALAERRYWDWFKLAFYRWPMGYGEKPGHVVGTSLVVIAGSTLAYQLFAPVARTPAPDSADVVGGTLLSSLPITPPPWVGELLTSLYFSVVTFTTLGYGDLQPASGAAQAVATLESFLGALLMALLVFVLGRRATW